MTPPRACVKAAMRVYAIPGPCDCEHGKLCALCAANIATAVLAAFVAREVEGPYKVVSPFPDGPLTRVRHESLFGHEWGFAYPHMARAVANVLNYLEAQRA